MQIDIDLFEQTLIQLGEIAGYPSELPSYISEWLKDLPISEAFREFISTHAVSGAIQVGPISILSHREVYSQTREFPFILEAGFLVVGAAPNGDPIVTRFRDGMIGYLSHENLWSNSNPSDVSRGFRTVSTSLGAFVQAALHDKRFPIDYYSV